MTDRTNPQATIGLRSMLAAGLALVMFLGACGQPEDEGDASTPAEESSTGESNSNSSSETGSPEEATQPAESSDEPDPPEVEIDPNAPPPPSLAELPPFSDLPEDVVVLAVGAYGGDERVDPADTQDPAAIDLGTTQIDVHVDQPGNPVVLVLGAYEPVYWNLHPTDDTEIIAVAASGHHRQAIGGVGSDTATFVASSLVPGDFENTFNVIRTSCALLTADDELFDLTGQRIDWFFDKPVDGDFFIGTDVEPVPEPVGDYDLVTFERENLASLLDEGKIRPATTADWRAWLSKHNEQYTHLSTGIDLNNLMNNAFVYDSYVVLEPLTLPDGMTGANSASFLIAEGVPTPEGPVGHNDFYWMEDGSTDSDLQCG